MYLENATKLGIWQYILKINSPCVVSIDVVPQTYCRFAGLAVSQLLRNDLVGIGAVKFTSDHEPLIRSSPGACMLL